MTDFETVMLELCKRVEARGLELCEKHDNPLAVTNMILLEELTRLELRMRELARAARTGIPKTVYSIYEGSLETQARRTLKAIAEGKDLP